MIKEFPKLYKKSTTGKLQEWAITAYPKGVTDSPCYVVRHGYVGGKIQSTKTMVTSGKNIGRANETTEWEQCQLEAESKWKKQLDKGYRENISDTDSALVLLPMLAKSYKDDGHKIKYPCCVQPKLDGLRLLSTYYKDNRVKLLSRKGKEFKALDHIKSQLLHFLQENPTLVLDGELYLHGTDFQSIISAVKRDEPSSETYKIQYHIYDVFDLEEPNWAYVDRLDYINNVFKNELKNQFNLVKVDTYYINNISQVSDYHSNFLSKGYEGIMLRNIDGLYEQDRRSPNLQKVKSFQDREFKIVDVEQGVGKFTGFGIFVCVTDEGTRFNCMPMGTEEERKNYYCNKNKYIGKELTVKFFEWTTGNNPVPRFPVGIKIKDEYE